MKKLTYIILTLMLLPGLCGCNNASQDVQMDSDNQVVDSQNSTEVFQTESNGLSYDLAVPMTIPAAITVYLDNEMNMVSVESGDADAETLLSGLDVAGKSYAETMELILQTAFDQGFLKAGDTLCMDLDPIKVLPNTVAQLFSPFLQFDFKNKLGLSFVPNLLIQEPEDGETKIEIDGQKLYVHRASVMDGMGDNVEEVGVITTYTTKNVFLEDPTKYAVVQFGKYHNGEFFVNFYDEDIRTRSYVINADGSFACWEYENENSVFEFSRTPDGMTMMQSRYANGDMKEYEHYQNGEYYTAKYLEGNIPVYTYNCYSDGSRYEVTYDEQGNRIGYSNYEANGNYYIYEFYPNGISKSEERMVDGAYSKTVYNEDGSVSSTESN